jgi:hypothetical protein
LHPGVRPPNSASLYRGEEDGVNAAAKLERLVRILPGVAGYQNRENARETDKLVRMRLCDEIRRLIRDLELDKRRLADASKLGTLPLLDRLAGKLETYGRIAEYATRGYSGLFDLHKVDLKGLEQLYAFDLRLFDSLAVVKARATAVHDSLADSAALERAAHDMETALDDLERTFDARRQLLAAGE